VGYGCIGTAGSLGHVERSLPFPLPLPFPRYLVPPMSKYSPQHHVLKHPQVPFLPQSQRPSFTPIQNNMAVFCNLMVYRYVAQVFLLLLTLRLWMQSRVLQIKNPSVLDSYWNFKINVNKIGNTDKLVESHVRRRDISPPPTILRLSSKTEFYNCNLKKNPSRPAQRRLPSPTPSAFHHSEGH